MGEVDQLMNKTADPNIRQTYSYTSPNKLSDYDFMSTAYEGNGGFKDGKYLVPHSREMFYETRKDIAFYKNFVKPILDAMVLPVFNKPAPREHDGDELFEQFIDDCDNLGTSLQSFSEEALTWSRLHGVTFVVVDNYTAAEQPVAQADAIADRVFPYVYIKKANQLKASKLDRYGNIQEIIFADRKMKVTIDSKEQEVDTYMRFTPTKTEIIYQVKEEWKILESYEHSLGFVPVIPVYSVKRKSKDDLKVDPPLYDIARINHAIFNKDSEIREIERSQGFSIFYIQTGNSGNLTIGANNVLMLPMETTIAPGFASPDSSIQKNLMDYQDKLKDDLFRIAEQNGVTGVDNKSGIAIQWDFYAHESVLKKSSMIATTLEEKIAYIFGEYTSQEIDYHVNYPISFQPNDKLSEIKMVDMYLQLDVPPKAKSLALAKVTRLMFPEVTADVIEEIIDEIDQAQEDESAGMNNDEAASADAAIEDDTAAPEQGKAKPQPQAAGKKKPAPAAGKEDSAQ